jgi:hypothetical protein
MPQRKDFTMIFDETRIARKMTSDMVRNINELHAAEAAVSKHVRGPLPAFDSAAAVYEYGVHQLGVSGSSPEEVFKSLTSPKRRTAAMAMDEATVASYAGKFPGVAKLKLR